MSYGSAIGSYGLAELMAANKQRRAGPVRTASTRRRQATTAPASSYQAALAKMSDRELMGELSSVLGGPRAKKPGAGRI